MDVHLTDNQRDCYTVLVSSAVRMEHHCPYYWANKNFEKAQQVGLDLWYYMGLLIKTGSWNTMLTSFGLTTLHESSLRVLQRTFHEELPHRAWLHPNGGRLYQNMDFGRAVTKMDVVKAIYSISGWFHIHAIFYPIKYDDDLVSYWYYPGDYSGFLWRSLLYIKCGFIGFGYCVYSLERMLYNNCDIYGRIFSIIDQIQ